MLYIISIKDMTYPGIFHEHIFPGNAHMVHFEEAIINGVIAKLRPYVSNSDTCKVICIIHLLLSLYKKVDHADKQVNRDLKVSDVNSKEELYVIYQVEVCGYPCIVSGPKRGGYHG